MGTYLYFGLAAQGMYLYLGLAALSTYLYLGLAALCMYLYLGLATLGTGIYSYADIMENYNMQKYTSSLEALADRRDGIL